MMEENKYDIYKEMKLLFKWPVDKEFSVSDDKIFKWPKDKREADGLAYALMSGLTDMTVRTMKRKEQFSSSTRFPFSAIGESICNNKYEGSFSSIGEEPLYEGNSIYSELVDYFISSKKDAEDYDDWHAEICDKILTGLGKFYIKGATYGKAQKVINITMKNLSVMDGAEDKFKGGYFDYCHMPLDSFILEWVYRKATEYHLGRMNIDGRIFTFCRDNFTNWSNLEKKSNLEKNGKPVLNYSDLVLVIRKIINEYNQRNPHSLTVFEAEFFIWRQMQVSLAAEALFDEDAEITINSKKLSKMDFRATPVNEKLKILKHYLDVVTQQECSIKNLV